MVSSTVKIKNPIGLHLRPAGILCEAAIKFNSKITFRYKNNIINAKSVLSVLGACVKTQAELELICEGDDEIMALQTIKKLIEDGIGEDCG